MENNLNNTRNGSADILKSETINELAHRHMLNQNHTTTDEELKNARIEFSDSDTSFEALNKLSEVDNNTVLPELPFENNNTTATTDENETYIKKENSIPNPYEILK